jgi:hypothetical protein
MRGSLDDIFDSVLFSISGVAYKMTYWRLVIRRGEDSISMSILSFRLMPVLQRYQSIAGVWNVHTPQSPPLYGARQVSLLLILSLMAE